MKRADQVFALRRVDPGFATNRAVDLRQQRGRDLNETAHHGAAAAAAAKPARSPITPPPKGDDDVTTLDLFG